DSNLYDKLTYMNFRHNHIKAFTATDYGGLETLDCSYNPNLGILRTDDCRALKSLNCSSTLLRELDLSTQILQTLNCGNTQLTSLELSELPALRTLDCSNNPQLENLSIQCPNLDTLWMNGNTQLTSLFVYASRLTAIELTDNTALRNVFFQDNTLLETLDLSSLPVLEQVACINSPQLKSVDCSNTQLTSLVLSELPTLQTLNCSNNLQLTSLTINNACLTSLDISNDTALESLSCHHNQLDKIDLSSNKKLNTLYCSHNQLSSLNLPENLTLVQISCDSNRISSLSVLAALRKQAQHGILSPQFVTATLQVGNVLNLQGEMYIDNRQTDLTLLDSNGNIIENMGDILADHGDGLLYFKNAGQYRLQLYNEFIDQNNSATPLIVYYDLTVVDSVVRPQFSIPSGAVLPDAELVLSTPTPDARIYYTTDGSEPNETALSYTAPIRITEAVTIKAVAIQDTFKSHIAIATYTIDTVARPTFSIPSGTVKIATTVSLSTTTPDASIIYTTDGAEPDNNALEYTEPIRITEAMTIRAVAVYKTVRSQIATATYTIDSVANEYDLRASRLRVYAQDRTIHLSETVGEVEVFTMEGHCVYRGHETAIPVKQSGLYVVSAAGRRWKVAVR
ncbi:MAG: chitobiase/beta-hexosaminidase C-terminal domain-containing protein, partial [Bacteroidales bacterium]|nr:chitobiase/beta-hexosaminidase C-terminal domain-containing protein [Bacteroidales bacterium]